MSRLSALALVSAFAASAVVASAASATTTLTVTDVNVDSYNTTFVPGHGDEITTAIILNGSLVVFCDDLEHNVNIGGGQSLPYQYGLVTTAGDGSPISVADSNRMGQIADYGLALAHSNDPDRSNDLTAVQAAIWAIEYGVSIVTGDPEINAEIQKLLSIKDNGSGRALGLLSLDGHQSFVVGVPEPATWALMIGGFGLAGASLRRRRAVLAR
jgi:hypothetical protein